VDHSKIEYEPFNKDFYVEHEEIQALPADKVRQVRYKILTLKYPINALQKK